MAAEARRLTKTPSPDKARTANIPTFGALDFAAGRRKLPLPGGKRGSGQIERENIVRSLRTSDAAEWHVIDGLMAYDDALAAMDARVAAIVAGIAPEQVLLVEHPPLYTAGTSAPPTAAEGLPFPLHRSGRGGQVTYHGPGQRVAYPMLDLSRRGPDVRAFVAALEDWIIATLAQFDVEGERREDRVGVWVPRPSKPGGPNGEPAEDKIAAIGIRLRRWVSFHGISLNVAPDLTHYAAITSCGVTAPHLGITSLRDLGVTATMAEVDAALRHEFEAIFGATA
jgi:lipoyl(octanoyl) transferase